MGDSFVVLILEKPQPITPEATEILGEKRVSFRQLSARRALRATSWWAIGIGVGLPAKLRVARSLLWAILQWPVDLTWFFSCYNYIGKHENTLIMFQEIHSTTCNGILVVTNESQLRSGKEEGEKEKHCWGLICQALR